MGAYAVQLGNLKQSWDATLEAIITKAESGAYSSSSQLGFGVYDASSVQQMLLNSSILQMGDFSGAGTYPRLQMGPGAGYNQYVSAGEMVQLHPTGLQLNHDGGGVWLSPTGMQLEPISGGTPLLNVTPGNMSHSMGLNISPSILAHTGLGLNVTTTLFEHTGLGLDISPTKFEIADAMSFETTSGDTKITNSGVTTPVVTVPGTFTAKLSSFNLDIYDADYDNEATLSYNGLSIYNTGGWPVRVNFQGVDTPEFTGNLNGVRCTAVVAGPSDVVRRTDVGPYSITATGYTVLATAIVPEQYKGPENSFRVKWTVANVTGDSAKTKIYVNGSPVGAEKTGAGAHSEDITAISASDTIEIWGYVGAGDESALSSIQICADHAIYMIPVDPTWS
jgi:hypothetical protein